MRAFRYPRRKVGIAGLVAAALAALAAPGPAYAGHSFVELVGPSGDGCEHFLADSRKHPSISADGSRIFFCTAERVTAGDTDDHTDIYARFGSANTLVSTGPAGGNGSFVPVFEAASEDGTRVFFRTAEPLVAEDTDSHRDIYEHSAGTTRIVSTGPLGGNAPIHVHGDRASFDRSFRISRDGTHAFFETAERLVAEDTDSEIDVYERSGGETRLVTVGTTGHGFWAISDDGTRAFFSTTDSLVPEDRDDCGDEFTQTGCPDLYERSGDTTKLVSTGPGAGGPDFFGAVFAAASPDGTRVFFLSREPLFDDPDGIAVDLFERSAGTTSLISTGPADGHTQSSQVNFVGSSADGSHVFFGTDERLVAADTDNAGDLYERFDGETILLPPEAHGVGYIVSEDGRRLIFESSARLVTEDTDHCADVYEYSGGATTLRSPGPSDVGQFLDCERHGGEVNLESASADGSRVFFTTGARLLPTDNDSGCLDRGENDFGDTFFFEIPCHDLYENHAGANTLISTGPRDSAGPFQARFRGISDDGNEVLFTTGETLVAEDRDLQCPPDNFGPPRGGPCDNLHVARVNGAPRCETVSADPSTLGRPRRDFRSVTVGGATDPDGDEVAIAIDGVTQDEPVRSNGDNTTPDARRAADAGVVELRAERSPRGDGRVYRIAFTASDGRGSCSGVAEVAVPRKKKRPAAVDSAPPGYDSFG